MLYYHNIPHRKFDMRKTGNRVTLTPIILSLTAEGEDFISMEWTQDQGVPPYDIYRGDGLSPSSFAVVGTTSGTTFTDSPLPASSTYTYYVVGNVTSNQINGTTSELPSSLSSRVPNAHNTVDHVYVYAVGTTIYAYDITVPASPALLSTLTSPTVAAAPQGLIGVPWTETIP